MKYWVAEAGVDGYRCDVAGFVPLDFWNNVRAELEAIKPVFMLAEWEARDLHARAFDATYAWSWYEAVQRIAAGAADVSALRVYYAWNEKAYPDNAMRMTFVSNHDKNAWAGTPFEQFGAGMEAAIVLSVIGEGIPLLYNGQEAGNSRRLAFFDRDPIVWREHPVGELYTQLFALKKANSALWNGAWGARMVEVTNSAPAQVLSFVRENTQDKVFAIFNFSAQAQEVQFPAALVHGRYVDAFSDERVTVADGFRLKLAPWAYRVFVRP
jgi:glycosidase